MMVHRIHWLVYSVILFAAAASAEKMSKDYFYFNASTSISTSLLEVPPGETHHVEVSLVDEGTNQTLLLPVAIINGKYPGPVLGLTAGVHGFEYSPILAAQRLISTNNDSDSGSIDASTLSGTILIVLLSNPASFFQRTPFVNPLDGKNLNRAFPGNATGSITERIADWITNHVISKCDYFVDIHSGDAPEDLMPYSAYYHHASPDSTNSAINSSMVSSSQQNEEEEMSSLGRSMALSMGFDYVIKFQAGSNDSNYDYLSSNNAALYCSAQAIQMGIPAVDIECGRLGRVEDDNVDKIVNAVGRLLCFLNMTSASTLCNNKLTATKPSTIIERRSFLESSTREIFYPDRIAAGDEVQEGALIGYITDVFGNRIEEVRADASGIILYMLGTPPVNVGDTIVCIGILDEGNMVMVNGEGTRAASPSLILKVVSAFFMVMICALYASHATWNFGRGKVLMEAGTWQSTHIEDTLDDEIEGDMDDGNPLQLVIRPTNMELPSVV